MLRNAIVLVLLLATPARGDDTRDAYVGTSLFMAANLVIDDHPPVFFQLNAGYQVTPNDRISVEAITWRYYHPLGIPHGRRSPDMEYPGHVREYGVGLAYQRTLWNGIYSSLSAVPLRRGFHDAQGEKIGDGFQLFMTLRLGYHLRLKNRVFVEPSIAVTAWPISTGAPEGFATQDAKWPSYFLFEPGLHAGVVF
jgi:hypothetical protein